MEKNWQLPVSIVSIIVGFLVTTQIKSQSEQREMLPSRRLEDLVVMLKTSEQRNQDLLKELSTLRAQVKELESGKIKLAKKQEASLDLAAGLSAVTGQGLEVVVQDSSKPLAKGEDPNTAIVHNDDLLRLVNELKAGGAEVVAVNDQRLVDTSEITCAGTTILVNKTRIAPPFVIKASGEPQTMEAALNMRGGILEYLQFYGIQVSISRKSEVLIPMYSGGSQYKFAKPVAPAAPQENK